jgi:hypothetical protein
MSEVELNHADDASPAPAQGKPRTAAVVGLLAGASVMASYLFAYCLINALAAADVIARWQPNHDPRPKYFFGAFVTMLALFGGVAFLARMTSRRQMTKIDEMESDDPSAASLQ